MSTTESKLCVFCGEDTRKKRKRDICDTYQEYKIDKIPSSLKKIYNKKISTRKKPHQPSVLCSVCNTPACFLCVKVICERMKLHRLHENDNWYKQMNKWIHHNIYPKQDFVGHCCEVVKQIEHDRASNVYSSPSTNNNILYDGYIHLPQLHILIPPPPHNCIDVHGFGKENKIDIP